MLDCRLFVPQSWDETCVPDKDGNVANQHARRLHSEPTATGKAGEKKPVVRRQLPPAEQIAFIGRRRAAAKIPDEQRYRPKWVIALEMLDELAGWGLRPPVLAADTGYGQIAEFRQGLSDREIRYIVATTSTTTVQPGDAVPVTQPYTCRDPRPKPAYPDPPVSIKDLAITHGPTAAQLTRGRRTDPAGTAVADRLRPVPTGPPAVEGTSRVPRVPTPQAGSPPWGPVDQL
jgi:hypothetical protein